MGEQHLAEGFIQHPFAVEQAEFHVFQRKAAHPGGPGLFGVEGDQRGLGRHDAVSRLLGQSVAVAGGAGGGIGHAAGSDHNGLRRMEGAGEIIDPSQLALAQGQFLGAGLVEHRNAGQFQLAFQCLHHVAGPVAGGENAAAALRLQGQAAALLEKVHHVAGAETGKGAVKELSVAGQVAHQLLCFRGVGDVAAAFSGDGQLASERPVALPQLHPGAPVGRGQRRHDAGRAAADDDDPGHQYSMPCRAWMPFW